MDKKYQQALERIREDHKKAERVDYGVKGMKWGEHSAETEESNQSASGGGFDRKSVLNEAVKSSAREASIANVFRKTYAKNAEDADAIKVALRFNDKEHYASLTDDQLEAVNKCLARSKRTTSTENAKNRISDIDKEMEKLNRAAYKAEHYGGNESGDYNTIDQIEKKMNQLENEKAQLSRRFNKR